MNIAHSMCYVIQRSRSLSEILNNAVSLIAQEMRTDVCSIYLIDPQDHRLRLMATQGLDPAALGKVTLAVGEGLTGCCVKEMRPIAVEDASSHPGFRYFPETREEQFHSFLGVPLAIRNRPVGAIVVQGRERRAYTSEETQALTALAGQLVGLVENARLIDALDRGSAGDGYLREVRSWRTTGRTAAAVEEGEQVLQGSPSSPGIAVGKALFRGSHDLTFNLESADFQGLDAERTRVQSAFEATRQQILKIQEAAEREAGEEHALIFSSHLLLLNDKVLLGMIDAALERSTPANTAIYAALEHFASRLAGVPDPYIQDRVEDILDLRSRILDHLLSGGARSTSLSDTIVLARGIPPSLVVELKAEGARGIITERGGPTSHGALLARSMGIPAVTGILDIVMSSRTGDEIIIDGGTGSVILRPTRETLRVHGQRIEEAKERRSRSFAFREKRSLTRDGVEVPLYANVGVAQDLQVARANGAYGVGLYRTEFPFMIREDFPSVAEQVKIYRRAFDVFPGAPVTFRLLDLGGDKFLPGNRLEADRNPFLGYRSIRILLENPQVLREQAQAFFEAAAGRPFGILIPMVSTVEEARDTLEHIRVAEYEARAKGEAARASVGAMIEVPGAVEIAEELADVLDFFSIGSNDLIQYTLAVDREHPRAASGLEPYHPAVLRLVRRTVEAGHRKGKQVALCGEMASRPRLALTLAALGVDSLSITPSAIPEIKRALATVDLAPSRGAVLEALRLGSSRDVRQALQALFPGEE